MEKSSLSESKRASRIKTLLKRENQKEKDRAKVTGEKPLKINQAYLADLLDRDPQNLSRDLVSGKISEKTCRKIGELFPEYNVMWLLGDSDFMLITDLEKDLIQRSDETNNACLQILDSAYREVCNREGIETAPLDNIPEILLLQGQLRDFAVSLMWNYTKNRDRSHFWGTLDQELDTIEKKLKPKE